MSSTQFDGTTVRLLERIAYNINKYNILFRSILSLVQWLKCFACSFNAADSLATFIVYRFHIPNMCILFYESVCASD